MATATATTPTNTPVLDAAIPLAGADVMKRGVKRTLPCTLTEREFMAIAKQRVDKEALLDQVVEDFDKLKSKHKSQLEELEGEIGKMRRELHTGEQDRTVPCVEIFVRGLDGAGYVQTLRMDVLAQVYAVARGDGMSHAEAADLARDKARVEQRPATPTETQRHLPDIDGAAADRNAPLLDQAAAAQGRAAASGESDGVPDGAEPGDEDDGLGEGEPAEADGDAEDDTERPPADETPAQRSARESEQGRAERRAGKGKRGGKAGK